MQLRKAFQEIRATGKKKVAVLVDPDRFDMGSLDQWSERIKHFSPDFLFIGGSLITDQGFHDKVKAIKEAVNIPLILFPGSPTQLTPEVDAVLFLSLISGRNPELLIGHHVAAAPMIRELKIEPIATGYMLIDGGTPTTASYISNTQPIPRDKPGIAVSTAMAGEMLGMHCLYLDAGSGAALPVPTNTIEQVRKHTDLPIIVGGGMRNRLEIERAFEAGADIAVVGTALEEEPELIADLVN